MGLRGGDEVGVGVREGGWVGERGRGVRREGKERVRGVRGGRGEGVSRVIQHGMTNGCHNSTVFGILSPYAGHNLHRFCSHHGVCHSRGHRAEVTETKMTIPPTPSGVEHAGSPVNFMGTPCARGELQIKK